MNTLSQEAHADEAPAGAECMPSLGLSPDELHQSILQLGFTHSRGRLEPYKREGGYSINYTTGDLMIDVAPISSIGTNAPKMCVTVYRQIDAKDIYTPIEGAFEDCWWHNLPATLVSMRMTHETISPQASIAPHAESAEKSPDRFTIQSCEYAGRMGAGATAGVTINDRTAEDSPEKRANAQGNGPINAMIQAVNSCLGDTAVWFKSFGVKAAADGSNAEGVATVVIEHAGRLYVGTGTDRDINIAGVFAYINAINSIFRPEAVEGQEVEVAAAEIAESCRQKAEQAFGKLNNQERSS